MADDVRRANNDHYISQFHLRLFADSQDCLHILNVKDKSTQCIQNASKSKIESFCRRNWSANQKIENIFGDVETKVSPAFKQLSSDPSKFAGYSKRTKELILEYIGINYIRSLEAPKSMEESSGAIESATNELVGSKDFKLSDLGIESLTRESELSVFAKVALRLLETLGNKNVIIATPPKHNQFIISDRPLSKISIHTSEHQSKSIDDTSTIFWMPISSKVGLLFESFSTKKFTTVVG